MKKKLTIALPGGLEVDANSAQIVNLNLSGDELTIDLRIVLKIGQTVRIGGKEDTIAAFSWNQTR